MKKILILAFLISSLSCSQSNNSFDSSVLFLSFPKETNTTNQTKNTKNTKEYLNMEEYLKKNFAYVHKIEGFYIAGTSESLCKTDADDCPIPIPNSTSPKDIFDHSVRLFSSFLDQDQNGILDTGKQELVKSLAKNLFFLTGKLSTINIHSKAIQEKYKKYTMSMQTDKWQYAKNWPLGTEASNNKITLNSSKYKTFPKLTSSTWRPEKKDGITDTDFNALWEETFHTITEAYNRYKSSSDEFSYLENSFLRRKMDADIAASTYETEKQNREEGGAYDKVTAVNEYIHQIWLYQFTGNESQLNTTQKEVWTHISSTLKIDFPKHVTNKPKAILGTTIKGTAVQTN